MKTTERHDGIPGAVDALEAAFAQIDCLTAAERAAAAAEIAYRLAAEAAVEGVPPLEHLLIRDSLAGALACIGYRREAHAVAAQPMPQEDAAPPAADARRLRLASAAPEVMVCAKGEDVLANDEQGRQVRGRVAWVSGGAVCVRDFATNESRFSTAAGVIRNFSRQPEAGAK